MSQNFERENDGDANEREAEVVNRIVAETIWETEEFLEKGRIQSEEERNELLHKLYAARAINNHPGVNDLIKYIEEYYGKYEGKG